MASGPAHLRHSPATREIRVVLYSHDSLGLGHLRRNLLIAAAFSQAKPNIQTLLISGTSIANAFRIPDSVDILSLPSLQKVENGRYEPKRLRIASDELTQFRTATILSAVQSFRPDLFIVDKVPRGVRRELDPILRHLRERTAATVILGLRDILDDAARVRSEWAKEENLEAIDEFYDGLWIYGDPAVYDPIREYRWSADVEEKSRFTGYLDRTKASESASADVEELLESLKLKDGFNLCVVGGGADGFSLAESAACADSGGSGTLILTGPYMPAAQLSRLKKVTAERLDVTVIRFSNEPVHLLRRAGRVVSMGGYNTLLELVGLGKRPLVVPRVKPRTEQLIRATRFGRLGLVDVLHPRDLSPDALSEWFNSNVGGDGAPTGPPSSLDLGGLPRIVDSVRQASVSVSNPRGRHAAA